MTERASTSDDRFYANLAGFEDFDRVADPASFSPVPGDWHVVVADIRDSTRAIAEGRYKDVNLVGAACITAASNAADAAAEGVEIAYVFGGDGATILVPDSLLPAVRAALIGAAHLAEREFDFELRIGAVSVADLRADGFDVTAAKLQLSPGNEMAQLGGGGIAEADRRIKADPESGGRYRIALDAETGREPDMTGLSCRWEPLRSQKGVMLCLMVLARSPDPDGRRTTYGEVLSGVETALGGSLQAASPVSPETMRFKWIPKGLRMEARLTRGRQPLWRRLSYLLFQSFVQFLLERFDKSAGGYDALSYREELRRNVDYRRFDDVLRLTLDCTQAQADGIVELLTRMRDKGRIVFGVSIADHALMTCLVFNLEQGEHVHFVDGGLGGFAAASVGFKRQLREMG